MNTVNENGLFIAAAIGQLLPDHGLRFFTSDDVESVHFTRDGKSEVTVAIGCYSAGVGINRQKLTKGVCDTIAELAGKADVNLVDKKSQAKVATN